MPPPATLTIDPRTSTSVFLSYTRNPGSSSVNKAAGMKTATPAHAAYRPTPDREDLLEAVLMTNTPPNVNTEVLEAHEEDDGDKEAAEEFRKQKRKFDALRKQNGGELTFRQDVEWMRIQSAEDARKKKRKRDLLKAREEQLGEQGAQGLSLFIDENGSNDIPNVENENDSDDGDELDLDPQVGSRKRRRPPLPRKEPRQISIQEAEYQSMRVALEAEVDSRKKKKKTQMSPDRTQNRKGPAKSKVSKARASKSSKSKAEKKNARGARKTAQQKRNDQRAVHQMSSLFTGDVFAEQAGEDAADEPTFTTTRRKHEALKELIASVPIDHKKTARSDLSILLAATKDFDGRGSVKPHGNNLWLVKGMKTALKAYQLLGSAFMRRRENASEEPRGGLVADQMGLGKTLMMLANIVNGRPPRTSEHKTTLLVASPSLLTQWAKEIETHTDGKLTMMRYGAGTRIDSNRSFEILAQHDIILTTYTEVMRSYPKNEPPIGCQTTEQKIVWWKQVFETERGVLHRMVFLRVVLDEAQAIKNHTGRTSIACRALMAHHRWALSGTPVLNGLHELYAYFKFLGVPHTGSFKIFRYNYCDTSDPENTERLLVRLSQFMIRRTHSDVMFGAPILKLPKADQGTHWCDFNDVERSIYDIVQQRFAKRINWMAQKGDLETSYSSALVMLLRLRQLTAHILMLQFVMRDLLEREDIERIREVTNQAATDSKSAQGLQIIAIREQLKALSEEQKKTQEAQEIEESPIEDISAPTDSFDRPNEGVSVASRGAKTGRQFGKTFNFKPYLKSLTTGDHWQKMKEKAECTKCHNRPRNAWITECHHLLCFSCYEDLQIEAAERGREHAMCKACGKTFRFAHECNADGELDDSQAYDGPVTRSRQPRVRPEREDIRDDWLSLGGKDVLPSAKTIAIKAQILNWIQENPDVKIIIYTQFLAMIRILHKVCQEEGWGAEQYHGKMSFTARDKAIASFADKPHVKILLASLRCGGLGLNLTMASRVIVIDPWWNSASEQQAFCRVFRIGQTDTTFMTRFCVQNSVDQRLIDMQERKKREIDEVMEDDGSTVKKMNIRDLMRLFGNLEEDPSGRPFIIVDNPDSRGGLQADRFDEGYADEI
ncbi:uncharacterized protein BDR25DRAFT_282108 [Lindgomyces ingoldianus]|uniref:Uncharacterized protein n=1 Tax=Lindgomyces ingoldianus TaxID=673940 RepID=A0ACB6R682_9PLEO|nr:uncharacterized protein BDR25DRAFT_282108 [Lindgomyces ingoldianus]KAF2473961.1 hypothetical protein BDR25DRAFT_282108 [Lindgomyces ingoldianus]